ncbi:hypothetical protein HK105_206345 [Polyrhizophydium stewartii]|uniref:Uncharacterized protein n=1 Tax=Polyrhizophydium stewartii TaxID=2732419 RepID=A0ABR4N3I8_9FUNG
MDSPAPFHGLLAGGAGGAAGAGELAGVSDPGRPAPALLGAVPAATGAATLSLPEVIELPAGCVLQAESGACGAWDGRSAFATTFATSVAAFDERILDFASWGFVFDLRCRFEGAAGRGTSSANFTGLRYARTNMCNLVAHDRSFNGGCTAALPEPPPRMCLAECLGFVRTLGALAADPAVCPPATGPGAVLVEKRRRQALQLFAAQCADEAFVDQDPTHTGGEFCIGNQDFQCGLASIEAVDAYCSGDGASDMCCRMETIFSGSPQTAEDQDQSSATLWTERAIEM